MRIADWFRKLHRRRQEHQLRRAEELALESPAERRIAEGGMEGLGADLRAAELVRETRFEDVERMAEGE